VVYSGVLHSVEAAMRRLMGRFFFASFAVFLSFSVCVPAICTAAPQQTNLTIKGNVYLNDESTPAQDVTVRLASSEGNMIAPETTTASGGFEFHGLAHGSYSLEIETQGYERASYPVDLSFSSARGIVIYLRAKSGGQPVKTGSPVSAHELSMPQKARDLMDSGKKKLYTDKNALEALQDFQAAVAVAPAYYEAYYQMAMAEVSLEKNEDAERDFGKSIESSSDKYGEAEIGLGTLLLNRWNNSEGEKAIRRGIALAPNDWLGHYELGRALFNEKRMHEAKESAEQARVLAPDAAIVYRLLSNIHLTERDYPALLLDLDAYIKLDPDSPMGIHAKKLREQVAAKIGDGKISPAAQPLH